MTLVPPPPPPPAPAAAPSPTDFNKAADFWRYTIGVNVIPANTRLKKTFIKWSQWQIKPIPEEQHEQWKQENAFADGMAIIVGKAWFGPHAGKYLIFIDLDNQKAIQEFCTRHGETKSLQEIAQKFIVEQHLDNRSKAHVFLYSELEFARKSSDILSNDVIPDNIPAFEIKGKGTHGIAYVAPSFHKDGHQYQIIGTTEPETLNPSTAHGMMDHLDDICKRYNLRYLNDGGSSNNNNDNGTTTYGSTAELFKDGAVIYEGHNRHLGALKAADSLLRRFHADFTEDEIKEMFWKWNRKHCIPPLEDKDLESIWEESKDWINWKIKGARLTEAIAPAQPPSAAVKTSAATEEQEQETPPRQPKTVTELPQPVIPLAWKNDYFEYLVVQAQKTIKEENALVRQILLTKLSAYSDDPNNLGIMAPTATGKTYPIMECYKFTPGGKEIRVVGSMSPKVLVREQGVLVDKDRKPIGRQVRKLKADIKKANRKKDYDEAIILQEELEVLLQDAAYILDLSGKTLLFLEPPELWNLLKPILAHDHHEIEHPFVDNIGHGIEVKRVITRGWPACIFCSAKDESKWDIWPEIESRFMIQSPNMIKAKYQQANRLIGIKKWQPRGVKQQLIISDKDLQLGKDCFLYLKHQIHQYREKTDSPIWAPFEEIVSEAFPSDKGQDNRAFNRFATILNMLTLCKAHLRYKVLYGNEELVIPSLRDLQETLHVMQNITGLPPHKLKFYNEYIVPLWAEKGCTPLPTKDICDHYNAVNKESKNPMNSDNLRKNYLQELVNHNYLEREQDPDTKATRYIYTPLIVGRKEEQEKEVEAQGPVGDSQKNGLTTAPTLERVFNNLHYSKLILPKTINDIPEDRLKQQILQLSNRRLTDVPLKICVPDGHEVTIEEFVEEYEKELKLHMFFAKPRLVGNSDSVKIAGSGGSG